MFGPAIRNLAIVIVSFSSQAFAQLTITTGDSTWSIGQIESELNANGGTGNEYTWSVVNGELPPGLALRTDIPSWFSPGVTAGVIGVATTPGTYPFTLQVTSGNETVTKLVTMKIISLVMAIDGQLPDASVGVSYSVTIATAGTTGSVSFALQPYQSLPEGLNPNPITGIISGTPTTPANYNFGMIITDSAGSKYPGININVSPMAIDAPASLPNATQGTPYSASLAVTGGTPPISYTPSCCLPNGINVNGGTGELSGTPNGPGQWAFTLDVSDATGAHLRRNFRLGVLGTPPILPSLPLSDFIDGFTIGQFQARDIAISGGTPPYDWEVTSGTLPPGLRIVDDPPVPPFWRAQRAWLTGTPVEVTDRRHCAP